MSGVAIGIVDTDVGPLLAPIDPWIWPSLHETGRWEPLVGDAVRSVLRPSDTVVNVGAHVGYFTRMAALAVGQHGRVYAYEPAPSNRRLLALNTADLDNVEIRPFAVSDEEGQATFTFSGINPGDHRLADNHPDAAGSMEVSVVRLDDEARTYRSGGYTRAPALLFVDAQGLDLKVLRGAMSMIDRLRPHIMIEWTPRDLDHADYPVIDEILDMGYTGSLIEGRHIVFNRAIDGDVIADGTGTLYLAPPEAP